MSNETDYAFVLCCSRSGSTLLRLVLDSHPSVWCPPELHLGPLCKRLEYLVSVVDADSPVLDAPADSRTSRKTRAYVEHLLRSSVFWKEGGVFCEKSITTVDHFGLVRNLFPEAKFICLYRHCLDVVHSAIEQCRFGWKGYGVIDYVRKNPANIVDALVEYWIDKTSRILDAERSCNGSSFRVKYESVVCQTSETIERLFRFIGLDWGDRPVGAVFSTPHQIGAGDSKIWSTREFDGSRIGKGRALPLELISPKNFDRMNDLLSTLDYPVVERNAARANGSAHSKLAGEAVYAEIR